MFDTKCHDLATVFLSDHPSIDTDDNRNALAQEIQNAIEGWIEDQFRTNHLTADKVRRMFDAMDRARGLHHQNLLDTLVDIAKTGAGK